MAAVEVQRDDVFDEGADSVPFLGRTVDPEFLGCLPTVTTVDDRAFECRDRNLDAVHSDVLDERGELLGRHRREQVTDGVKPHSATSAIDAASCPPPHGRCDAAEEPSGL